ncbi:hypothetical protein [Corynebacterium sp. HS2168-gen11]|uniref:hypothetical protein n=1 Tax=Corynebacterium sp. HS2168-gen11 TaxID=2974027 RepID=UPI00216B4FA8|nr:hypothetical protein [Corynebacterium sp. HS2168-gen11]MCS4536229.1 hypothetical protein [Corynebacterium sp. HS2168-gen11]
MPATLALSSHLEVGFTARGEILSCDALMHLGVSIREIWDGVATSMLAAARDADGLVLRTRPASVTLPHEGPGVEVDMRGALPASWLAHPRTATVLLQHFEVKFHQPVRFFSPDAKRLFVFPASVATKHLTRWAEATYAAPFGLAYPCEIERGFPTHHYLHRVVHMPTRYSQQTKQPLYS